MGEFLSDLYWSPYPGFNGCLDKAFALPYSPIIWDAEKDGSTVTNVCHGISKHLFDFRDEQGKSIAYVVTVGTFCSLMIGRLEQDCRFEEAREIIYKAKNPEELSLELRSIENFYLKSEPQIDRKAFLQLIRANL